MTLSDFIKRIPIPLSGVALAFATLGNTLGIALAPLGTIAESIRILCGIISGCLLLLVLLRITLDRHAVANEYDNVAAWTVTPTIFMATMILATYLKPILGIGAFALWICALSLQLVWVCLFIFTYVRRFDIKNVLPSWFIVFVGYVVGTVTSVAFDMTPIGVTLFVLGLMSFVIWLPVISYRFFIVKDIAPPLKPLTGIFLAPANLCLAGYLALIGTSTLSPIPWLVHALVALSALSFIVYLAFCVPLMLKQFYPSFSAFTFPIAITALAYTQLSQLLVPEFTIVATCLQILATGIVVFVFMRYLIFIFKHKPQQPSLNP
jgi:exfoliative toxin A/B